MVLKPVLYTCAVLYTVTRVTAGPGLPLDLLTSEADCDCTELTVDITGESGPHFNIQGFRRDNVVFISDHTNMEQV